MLKSSQIYKYDDWKECPFCELTDEPFDCIGWDKDHLGLEFSEEYKKHKCHLLYRERSGLIHKMVCYKEFRNAKG